MLKSTLTALDKRKLKRWILLFFFALAIPTAFLVQQSYSRLKWETFHQHQLLANELASRINGEFSRLINVEELRPFTDYSFLNVAGDPKANLLQRSPLSKFPIESEITGIIGFFQVNNDGELMTPLVPEAIKLGKSPQRYGIANDELNARLSLQDKIQTILSKNNLVKKKDSRQKNKEILSKKEDSTGSFFSGLAGKSRSNLAPSQVAFDQLKEAPKNKIAKESKLGRLDDLRFSKRFKNEESRQSVIKSKKKSPKKVSKIVRREQNVLPESELTESAHSLSPTDKVQLGDELSSQTSDTDETFMQKQEADASISQPVRIRTFESTIDPFEFSQLDSGHFVLFRNVWLKDKRFIQGLLIAQKPFLESIVNTPFRNTSLSQMSKLLVIHQGNVLTAFSGRNTLGYLSSNTELNGELLYQTRLSAPLSDLQLLFSINQLPAGAGGKVILWLSAILASILCIGFYLMYRLGLSQINLAKQQQNFVSAVSHELKTPLTSIRMYGEILREGWASEEKKKNYYEFIYDESERLSRLINNVLHLARMTRNEQTAVIKKVSVKELIDQVQSKVSTQIKQAGFTLNIQCKEDCNETSISVDEDWFIQIMINLVDNAIKFSVNAETKKINLSCHKSNDGKITFSIRDYGPGIDRQQMKNIFKLFYRSENELTRETVGTGIGLALVHQMTSAMGGKIETANQSPGAEFKISFSST